jgi:hypothetical protein
MWAFFHGPITNRWETHKTQRRVSHIVCYTVIHRSVCGRSRIGSIVPKLSGGDDFETHLGKTSDINNPKYQCIVITQWLLASQTTPSKGKDHEQWKCDIFGLVKKMHRMWILFSGTPGWKTLPIIKVNITLGRIIPR